MPKGEVRARMTESAVRLLAEHGPAGASFGDVLKATGASRGSIYHHFPQGKRELYDTALEVASSRAYSALDGVRGESAEAIITAFFDMWRTLLTHTDLRMGCAVLAIAVAGDDADNTAHAGEIFGTWRAHLATILAEAGLGDARATSLAALAIAAAEGAVALARAEQSMEAFELVADQVTHLARD